MTHGNRHILTWRLATIMSAAGLGWAAAGRSTVSLVDHEHMIHVSEDLTSKILQTAVLSRSLAKGLQSTFLVALTAHQTPPDTAIVARGVTELASSQG